MVEERYPIESGIPLPGASHERYRFQRLQVGDSFPVPENEVRAVRGAASAYGRDHNMKLTVRRNKVTNEFRCWRVE